MKKLKKTKLLLSFIITLMTIAMSSISQSLSYDTIINGNNAKVKLPWDYYLHTNKFYPTHISFPGLGEVGNDISKLLVAGPANYIVNTGWNGGVKIGNDSVYFITISMQPSSAYQVPASVNNSIIGVINAYRESTLHLSGLSMGAWMALMYVSGDSMNGPYRYASKIKSVVNIEGVVPSDGNANNSPYPARWANYANQGGKLLCFEQVGDPRQMDTYVNVMNSTVSGSAIKISTNVGGGGHCCWEYFFGGSGGYGTNLQPQRFTIDGISQNMYEWMASTSTTISNFAPTVNAGSNQAITLPTISATLKGSASDKDGTISSSKWTLVSGALNVKFGNENSLVTTVSSLTQGIYIFRLTVTDNGGLTSYADTKITVNTPSSVPTSIRGTALDFNRVLKYTEPMYFGENVGYYPGSTLTEKNLAFLISQAWARTMRVSLPDRLISGYGVDSRKDQFDYYVNTLKMKNLTCFIGEPNDSVSSGNNGPINRDTTAFIFTGNDRKNKTFKGQYLPIWADSNKTKINANNTYAAYVYKTVKGYGDKIKRYEIINEPDFTYGSNGWDDNSPTSWYKRDPSPDELQNIKAPVYYIIREMRVAWDVIKTLYPNSYVCTGGIGYPSFLDALLRNTDNPVDGSVTPDYPLSAGAYFDVLSYHTYPMYGLAYWDNANGGSTKYRRHSDAMVDVHIKYKKDYDSLLRKYGFNDTLYPAKHFIVTETDCARETVGTDFGSINCANNYIIKCFIVGVMNGIEETYKYGMGEGGDANEVFNKMGIYGNLTNPSVTINNAPKNPQWYAMKTVDSLMYGRVYDPQKTASINIPAGVRGGAFKDSSGKYIYVLWAITGTDLSEVASATYTFPSLTFTGEKKEYNYCSTYVKTNVGRVINLTGYPSFIIETTGNILPTVNAGTDKIITAPVSTVTLNGSGTDSDGTIVSYKWEKVSGGGSTIVSSTSASTVISGLKKGVYKFSLTVTDNNKGQKSDTVTVTVNQSIRRVLIDVGPQPTFITDANGYYWNNITDARAGTRVVGAKTTDNEATTISLQVITRIDGNFNTSGNGVDAKNVGVVVGDYPISATTDYAFAYGSVPGQWKINGLDNTKTYTVKFWGRKNDTFRSIEIKRSDESGWQSYDAANNINPNNNASFTFTGKTEMAFDIRVKSGSQFGYINVIDITWQ